MSGQERTDRTASAHAGTGPFRSPVGDGSWDSAPTSGPAAAPAPGETAPGDTAPRTGDDAIDADVAALTAAAPGPLPHVLETAERLHQTLQRRLAERGDA